MSCLPLFEKTFKIFVIQNIVDNIIYTGDPVHKLTVRAHSSKSGKYIYWYISCRGTEYSYNHAFKYI